MSYRIEAATKEEWAERALSGEKKLADLKDSIKELFSLLDATEETDEGQGCECGAYGEHECGCGADWTPREVYELRDEVTVLRKALNDIINGVQH